MFAQRQPPITIKTRKDIAGMKAAGQLVADAFGLMRGLIRPGVVLRDVDQAVTAFLRQNRAEPLYLNYRGTPPSHPPFPGVICASVNHEVCHGLPDSRVLKDGDIVGIDIGLSYKGYCGDACVTFPVGTISAEAQKLLRVTQEALRRGIAAAQPGRSLTDIGALIQIYVESQGFSIVREWGGHGIGKKLHEPPHVPHIGPAGQGPKLRPGMTFTIEPMVNVGTHTWTLLADGWTVVTNDGKLSAQFEHSIAITDHGAEILTPWDTASA